MENQQDNLEAMVDRCLDEPDDDTAPISFDETDSTAPGTSSASYQHTSSSSFPAGPSNSTVTSTSNRDIFYCENYLDLNDILAQSNRLSVTFQRTIPKLGFLDPGAEDDRITKGTKLELPLWIVKELKADQVVNVATPKGYNTTYREILEADANCVNLHKLGPNFYRMGQHLSTMNLSESEDIANSLINTFATRFQRLVNFALSGSNVGSTKDSSTKAGVANLSKAGSKSSHNANVGSRTKTATSAGDDINTLPELLTYRDSLDNWEKDLLTVGQNTARQLKRWENRDLTKVKPSEMVTNLHKRKRLVEQHQKYTLENANNLSQSAQGRGSSPLPSSSFSSS